MFGNLFSNRIIFLFSIILCVTIAPIILGQTKADIRLIENTDLQNYKSSLSINIENVMAGTEYSGFDFLISYNPKYSAVIHVEPGQLINLNDQRWEYFTYRLVSDTNRTGTENPRTLIHIIGQHSFDPQNPGNGSLINSTGELAKLNFIISYDRNIGCMYLPIEFYWLTCDNNVLINHSNNVPDISNMVFNSYGDEITSDTPLPSGTGASSACQTGEITKSINFYNSGIDMACVSILCDNGDLNLNHHRFDIGDYVLFETFFVYGIGAFSINLEGQIAATDINCDGMTLSVADIVMMHRIMKRDAAPCCSEIK